MVDVANVANGKPSSEGSDASAPENHAGEQSSAEPEVAPTSQQRAWARPKSPVTRAQADKLGRSALDAATSIARFIAGVARHGGRAAIRSWRAIDEAPAALKVFLVAGLLLFLGLAGSIAHTNSLGLICTVVVIPVCSMILGVLGHRWYTGDGEPQLRQADERTAEPASDSQRSIEYVDKKLAVALNSFGTERHQQAVIALVQAKTAVELTLGTEQDNASYDGAPLPRDDQFLRPRIRVGPSSKSLLRESNSMAAS